MIEKFTDFSQDKKRYVEKFNGLTYINVFRFLSKLFMKNFGCIHIRFKIDQSFGKIKKLVQSFLN